VGVSLAAKLSALGNAATYPFFGGWVAPEGNNTQQTVTLADNTRVVCDVIGGAPVGDAWVRAYYRRIADGRCNMAAINLYVVGFGMAGSGGESAYLRDPAQPQLLTAAGIASTLGSPAAALPIYGALMTAATATPPNLLAASIAALLTPGSGAGLDFNDPATVATWDVLVAMGVLTADQATLLKTIKPNDFE
jgi:hypothetical protein